MGRLDARVALITGASRGFGRAIALAFGEEGVNYHENVSAAAEVTAALEKRGARALARIKELPVRHLGSLNDVAYCALFLSDEAGGYLTGQVLQPNGGWVMP
jgi:3-oxoacyl-[acyl-carrier protein] reductase